MADLARRLRDRRAEIESTVLTRVYGVADPSGVADPQYAVGLRAAIWTALEYGIEAIEAGGGARVPAQLLEQARAAARNDVSLDAVLRRYFAGYALLGDFVIGECSVASRGPAGMQDLLRALSAAFDRLVAEVARSYTEEAAARFQGADRRRLERVKRVLAGEPLDLDELNYELAGWHLAAIASGHGAAEWLRELAGSLERRLLLVRPDPETAWAWLGGRSRLDPGEIDVGPGWDAERMRIAVGEPGQGPLGWRLTHRQAAAALQVAVRGPAPLVRYAEVALLSAALRDEVLALSLRRIFLDPLESEHDSGGALKATLAAYFDANRNGSSAAAALGISRNTVSIRLRSAEERIGSPVEACAAELETALRLGALGARPDVEGR